MASTARFLRAHTNAFTCSLSLQFARQRPSHGSIISCIGHPPSTIRSYASTALMARAYLPLAADNIEEVEEYRNGGFHPVHLGDVLNGRYRVLHKLGSGGFSTTWLARDTVDGGYYALKILKAGETAPSQELRMLQWLSKVQTDHPGRSYVRSLATQFAVHGPNGQHICLVTKVAGPSLQQLYNVPGHGYTAGARRLRADIALKARRQLAQAVDFLHCHEMCHGDLTLSNVLLALQSMDSWDEEHIYEAFGTPKTVDLVPTPGLSLTSSAPRYIVEPAGIPDAKYLTHDIMLVDFGETFSFQEPPCPEDIGIPLMYSAPETIFESKVSSASEAWSLACVLFEIRAGNPLFTTMMGGRDEIIQQMVQMSGRLPSPWWESWDKRSICFDEDGKPLKNWPNGVPMAVKYPLKEMVADIGTEDDAAALFGPEVSILEPMNQRVPEEEAQQMEDLLSKTLKLEPRERLTVRDILRHPWNSEKT